MKTKNLIFVIFLVGVFFLSQDVYGQVTTATINGQITDEHGEALAGATILAAHKPSGTRYGVSSQRDGRFTIPGMRVGGPYTVTVTYIGFGEHVEENIALRLGTSTTLNISMRAGAELGEVVVQRDRITIIGSDRTGASVSVGSETIERMPTINRRIGDIYRLTPQMSGSNVAGQSGRFNNITVDGSAFNNSFGLGNEPGDRTNVSPISMDALQQIQVNIAPYDVSQGGFTGAAINMVTRSGTNEFSGSAYYNFRNQSMVGTQARGVDFNPGEFTYNQIGIRLGGPIVQDKLFFFANYEDDARVRPMTTFRANTGGEPVGGSTTRVLESDLNELSSFLSNNFGYETGPFQGYDGETGSRKFLIKLDYNFNDRNTFTLRYNQLDSRHDQLMSNSSSLGAGSRRTNLNALNFGNSNYVIQENIRSVVAEWNSRISNNMFNNLFIGYTLQDESRGEAFKIDGKLFPMVDILDGGTTYTSFGSEPFTPANDLAYSTYQLQNTFNLYLEDHYLTFGAGVERFESETSFFPGSQSVYVYNSLDDFYTDAQGYLDNPNRTSSDVPVDLFQVRWSNIPGAVRPLYELKVTRASLFAQNEWKAHRDFKLTAGLRIDVPFFENTGLRNEEIENLTFMDDNGNSVMYSTNKLPNANILWSPRLGFNWDVLGQGRTQIRGGTGIFTGRPRYNWLSNVIGNNGIQSGFERVVNTNDRPFHPDPDHYKPSEVTGEPASQYEVNLVDPDYRFPQVWRSSVGVDQELPWMGLVGTAEVMYNRDINGTRYINVNLTDPDSRFTGVDDRPRWTEGNRIHEHIDNAILLTNQGEGYAWDLTASLERPFRNGWFAKIGYNYGEAKNKDVAGSVATGSWNRLLHSSNPNNSELGFSAKGGRFMAASSYRSEYFSFGSTTFSIFAELLGDRTSNYGFSGDLAGDGGNRNNKIYIHRDISEMNFEEYSSGGRTFSAAEQAAAWDAYIEQDAYLSKNRGSYAERGAVVLPSIFRADFSVQQEFFTDLLNNRNALTFRADFLNIGNLLNSDWGVSQTLNTTTPLLARGADENGEAVYRLRNQGGELVSNSFRYTNGLSDVFQVQFSLRYTFN
ncbi:carboxypeptidase regulatory-like domain-containing protein [soil metagenome]